MLLSLLKRLITSLRCLPPQGCWRFGRWAGACFACLPGRDQRRAREHLRQAYPAASPAWIEATAQRAFAHAGGMALWMLWSLGQDPQRLKRSLLVEGRDHLAEFMRASRSGSGTVVFTAHFGNWELLGRLVGALVPVSVVGRRLRSPLADALVKWMRTGTGCRQIDQQEGLRPVLRDLRDGRSIGCLADQDVPALSGVFVPWFGQAAYTPIGPAQLALMVPNTALQVLVCYRRGRRWCLHAGPRWQPPPGDRAAAAQALTQRATAYIEGLVRRHPSQWVWWHRRWRTRPEQRPRAPVLSAFPPQELP